MKTMKQEGRTGPGVAQDNTSGEMPTEKLGHARHRMIQNPDRGDNGRVLFRGALDDAGDLEVRPGETVTLSHAEWERVKDQEDERGRKYLVKAPAA